MAMKKIVFALAALLTASATFVSCSNDDEIVTEVPTQGKYIMTVHATKGDDATRATLTEGDSPYGGVAVFCEWEAGDEISVYNSDNTLIGTLKAQGSGSATNFMGSLTSAPSVNETLTLKYKSANYATQNGTLAYIAANCDYATTTTKVETVEGNKIGAEDAWFENQQAIVKFTLKNKADNSSLPVTQLKVNDGTNTYTVNCASSDVVYVALPGFSGQKVALVATSGTTNYDYITTSDVTFANAKFYRVAVKMNEIQPMSSASSPSSLGRVIATDGKMYTHVRTATLAGTTASGIIAYVGSAGSADTSSETYKGLAISLVDYFGKIRWYDNLSSGLCVSHTGNRSQALQYKDGIACTATLANSNGTGMTSHCNGHYHQAAKVAYDYSTSRPDGVSRWFLPAMGQWNMIVQGLATKNAGSTISNDLVDDLDYAPDAYYYIELNSAITNAGGTGFVDDEYWSSTLIDGGFNVWTYSGAGYVSNAPMTTNNTAHVRPVFAF